MSSLFVGNLSAHVRHRELENVFRRFGRSNLELKDGFGFVVYEEHRDAKRALEALQGKSICGEQPSISWARKRRPFQRYSGKTNYGTRDKYQSRRRFYLETERGLDDIKRDEKFLDEVKDILRGNETEEVAARSAERGAEWKDSVPEKLGFEEEIQDMDPLDSGRWDPNMDCSPENMMVDDLLEGEEHALHDKDKPNEKGGAHEKLQGSPRDGHIERPSREYRNSSGQHKRGHDAFTGRPQERCYNCGQSGHVKWQCRSRPKRIGMHSRDNFYDSRRNDSRNFNGRGGFGGIGGGRFRGTNGSRRILNRDIEAGYSKRSLRRHNVTGDWRHHDPMDGKTRDKDRRRRHRSESPKDDSSRGRSKRKHKRSSKTSTHSTRKRQRSSSDSPSSSRSAQSSSSSPLESQSHSAASRSRSSNSGSQSSSSHSQSRSSKSQSSRSRSSSACSSSRSQSVSSQSRKSPTRSGSQSPSSHSHGISSASPNTKRVYSPSSHSQGQSGSSMREENKEMATSRKLGMQEKESHESTIDSGIEERNDWRSSPEGHDTDQTDAKKRERRRMWSREAKKQKTQSGCDTEEPCLEAELQYNGVKVALKSGKGQVSVPQDGIGNEPRIYDSMSLKSSEVLPHSQMADASLSLYMTVMKEGRKGSGGPDDGQAALASASFGAARLWPWEAILYRRIKRGPISTANYERRMVQNEEFGIKDTFVRSSSGWWEKPLE